MTDLDSLLRQYLDDSQNAEDRRDAARKISAGLLHPQLILDSSVPGEKHPLKQDALRVSDAFEAVTNGMMDAETLARLDGVERESPLFPWVLLIRGIRALYAGETEEAVAVFSGIEPESAPFCLAGLLVESLKNGSSAVTTGVRSPAQKAFLDGLFRDDRVIRDAFNQLETCAESGLDDLLIDTLILLLKELVSRDLSLARSVFFWGMERWSGRLLAEDSFPGRIRSLFGKTAGLGLLAESTRELSPDRSLFFHLEAFEGLIRETTPDAGKQEAFRQTVDSLWIAIEKDYEVDESYRNYFFERLRSIERQLGLLLSDTNEESFPPQNRRSEETVSGGKFVQLDLFG